MTYTATSHQGALRCYSFTLMELKSQFQVMVSFYHITFLFFRSVPCSVLPVCLWFARHYSQRPWCTLRSKVVTLCLDWWAEWPRLAFAASPTLPWDKPCPSSRVWSHRVRGAGTANANTANTWNPGVISKLLVVLILLFIKELMMRTPSQTLDFLLSMW